MLGHVYTRRGSTTTRGNCQLIVLSTIFVDNRSHQLSTVSTLEDTGLHAPRSIAVVDFSNLAYVSDRSLPADLINVLSQSGSALIRALVKDNNLQVVAHPHDPATVVEASIRAAPRRQPSIKAAKGFGRRKNFRKTEPTLGEAEVPGEKEKNEPQDVPASCTLIDPKLNMTLAPETIRAVEALQTSLDATQMWRIVAVRPYASSSEPDFNDDLVMEQIRDYGVAALAAEEDEDEDEANESGAWNDDQSESGIPRASSVYALGAETASNFSKDDIRSVANLTLGGDSSVPELAKLDDDDTKRTTEVITDEQVITNARKWWVWMTWSLTWYIPSFTLSLGGMKRDDIRMAWREKVALVILILLLSGMIIFIILGLGPVLCPNLNYFSPEEVSLSHNTPDDLYASLRGIVYDITAFSNSNHGGNALSDQDNMVLAVTTLNNIVDPMFPPYFPVDCAGLTTTQITLPAYNSSSVLPVIYTHTISPSQPNPAAPELANANFYVATVLPRLKGMVKGTLSYEMDSMTGFLQNQSRIIRVINDNYYDISDYVAYYNLYNQYNPDVLFLPTAVYQLFTDTSLGMDITSNFNSISFSNRNAVVNCLNNVFYIGKVDYRNSPRCTVTNDILLAGAVIMVFVIFCKFLASLQLGAKRHPEELDKFVIVQVPCYTEDEESLAKTINSVTALEYDDKRKLLFIIADGMIIGSGNDRPTPRIVLDILGVDPKYDPEPVALRSVGAGSKQLNYGKVYSGLYEYQGRIVPFIVVVKVGKPSEMNRPGNRGKRDSQIILMSFLNTVHDDLPMSPLQIELFHQIKNIIGVHPYFYEFILMVDADTEVAPDALTRLMACTVHDSKIMGICGETGLANEEKSFTTMIQVYEYYISHHLSKAFESLFGSVTCLPGCFCMYRIRGANKGSPLIASKKVIDDYSVNIVDTLHKKNLLSLGEDRYLTTLMMKHFPHNKMTFTPDAKCRTVAPDQWSILLSQRRRWINSTVHNLAELLFLPQLCGFCCFSCDSLSFWISLVH